MVFDKHVIYQYYAGLCANIISINYGAFCGWPSASFLELQAPDSPLDTGPMTNMEGGIVGAMLCVGGLTGAFFFSWLADKIGRKRCLLSTALPAMIAWAMLVYARNPYHLYIARIIGGFSGGGVFSIVPLYVTEFSETKVRGTLGSFLILGCNCGILCAFILGLYFKCATVAKILSLLTVLFVGLFSFLPESPQYLIRNNKIKDAERALRYFRNVGEAMSKSSEELKSELEQMQVQEKPKTPDAQDNKIKWSDINNRIARKALMIGVAALFLNQLCGCFAMISYSGTIFQQAGSNLSPKASSIIVGVIQFFGSYSSTMLVERAGRKILLITSAIGTGLGHICLGTYSYLTALGYDTHAFNWLPVTSFSFTIFIANVGILSLPFLVVSEIMPPKIRNVGSMFCMANLWVLAFFILMYFPVLSDLLGMHGVLFILATNCFVGATFLMIFLPETKGKSIETILALL